MSKAAKILLSALEKCDIKLATSRMRHHNCEMNATKGQMESMKCSNYYMVGKVDSSREKPNTGIVQ